MAGRRTAGGGAAVYLRVRVERTCDRSARLPGPPARQIPQLALGCEYGIGRSLEQLGGLPTGSSPALSIMACGRRGSMPRAPLRTGTRGSSWTRFRMRVRLGRAQSQSTSRRCGITGGASGNRGTRDCERPAVGRIMRKPLGPGDGYLASLGIGGRGASEAAEGNKRGGDFPRRWDGASGR